MKRKATKSLALAISIALVIPLTACGDGSGEEGKDVVTPVEAQPMLSELELEILNLETKYNKGEFTGADYLALADAYSRAGDIRKQRDMLEQDYRLYEDADAFSTLQGLSVSLEEETEEIRSRAQEMLNDLELPEYLDESVNLIDSADWFSTMMPKLKEGQRSYYLERDAQPLFYAQVGYTGEGQRFSKVWYTGSETKRFLSQEGTIIRLVTVTSTVAGAEDPTSTAEPIQQLRRRTFRTPPPLGLPPRQTWVPGTVLLSPGAWTALPAALPMNRVPCRRVCSPVTTPVTYMPERADWMRFLSGTTGKAWNILLIPAVLIPRERRW